MSSCCCCRFADCISHHLLFSRGMNGEEGKDEQFCEQRFVTYVRGAPVEGLSPVEPVPQPTYEERRRKQYKKKKQ